MNITTASSTLSPISPFHHLSSSPQGSSGRQRQRREKKSALDDLATEDADEDDNGDGEMPPDLADRQRLSFAAAARQTREHQVRAEVGVIFWLVGDE